MHACGWDNQCTYSTSDSQCYYDYLPECVQYKSKPSWELAIKKLANATSNHSDRIEEMLDELASHFGRMQGHLHVLCEVISSNHMQMTLT